uniref:Pepsin inhibitor-3-like repeated domain-containing protein n=1 Tax=Parascaris univalens TaxID=6257 RepID=A0A915AFC6_PARUN
MMLAGVLYGELRCQAGVLNLDVVRLSVAPSLAEQAICTTEKLKILWIRFQGKRLFINNVYVREISEEEERRLDEFDKQYREYMNHIEQVNRQFVNDDDSAETSTTSSSDPTMPSVALPEDPRICISL